MDYIYYILIILGILLLCLYLVRIPGHVRLGSNRAALAERARKRGERARSRSLEDSGPPVRHELLLKRGTRNIPTPWGWPGHDENIVPQHRSHRNTPAKEAHHVSESLNRWVSQLVSEKQNIEDREYLLKKNASVRALLEDRYGHASRMSEMAYQKTRAPLLRDPNQPHDQMDNFPSGRGEEIASGLENQPVQSGKGEVPLSRIPWVELKEIRTPWGW